MKKILVILAVFGLVLAGCSNGSTDPIDPVDPPPPSLDDGRFEGTWSHRDNALRIYFNGSNFTLYSGLTPIFRTAI